MAISVAANDQTIINTCDALDASRFNVGTGVNNPSALDPDIKAQGTNSWRARVTAADLGGVGDDFGGVLDIEGKHILIWGRSLDNVSSAGQGWRIRWSTVNGAATLYQEINVGDNNTTRNVFNGFFCFCADPLSPNHQFNSAGNLMANARAFALLADHQTASSRDTFFLDELKILSGITVTGGAATPRGALEIAAADATAGRGTFVDINGVFYILGGIVIGDVTAATNSTFEDSNKVWVFQDGAFATSFHVLSFIGGTGTNAATFGTLVGSGITAVGVSGNSFLSAGLVPFNVVATDADIAVAFYGCTLLGPAALAVDTFRNNQLDNGGVFTNETLHAVSGSPNATVMLESPATVNDANYIGHDFPFSNAEYNVAQANNGTFTVVYEYWNGSSWVVLSQLTDAGLDFQSTGVKKPRWEIPSDWATTTVNGSLAYYFIRIRVDTVSAGGTLTAAGTFVRVDTGGRINLEQANADMISCTITNFEIIRIRNGALFRKCNVIAGLAAAENAAIDLGDADPATDSFRDVAVQNCINGIQLRPTLTGKITYNFRNITFAGNTFDVLNSGVATVTDSYGIANQSATSPLNDVNHGYAQSVTGDGNTLSRAQFMLSKTASPTGTAVAKLYAHTGTFGTDSEPTGVALATSETLDVSTLDGVLTMTDFEFRDEFLLVNTTKYVLTIEYTAGTAVNIVNVGTDTSAPTHAGNFATGDNAVPIVWTAVGGTDAIFELRTGAIAIINVLQGGDTPSVSTLNGATIVNNTVTLTVQVNDPDGNAVQGARVRIQNDPAGTLITQGTTDAAGTFTDATFNFVSDTNVETRVRLKGFKFFRTPGVITSAGLTVGVRFEPNKIVDLP